jgi:hypothetical protein
MLSGGKEMSFLVAVEISKFLLASFELFIYMIFTFFFPFDLPIIQTHIRCACDASTITRRFAQGASSPESCREFKGVAILEVVKKEAACL